MSDIKYVNPRRDGWWSEFDLSYHRIPVTTRHELEVEQAALAVLAAHPPRCHPPTRWAMRCLVCLVLSLSCCWPCLLRHF